MEDRLIDVGGRCSVRRTEMVVSLECTVRMASQQHWHTLVVMHIRVAHRAAIEHQRVVEQSSVAVWRRGKLVKVIAQQADRVAVDFGKLGDTCRALAMVRARVKWSSDPATREDALVDIAAHLEC